MDCERAMAASKNRLAAIKVGKKRFALFMLRSELQPCAELHLAIVVGGLVHEAKAAVARPHVRKLEALVIGHVEHFCTDLKLCTLANLELLGKGHVQVLDSLAAQIGEVARRVPGDVVARIGEARLIEVRLFSSCGFAEADS